VNGSAVAYAVGQFASVISSDVKPRGCSFRYQVVRLCKLNQAITDVILIAEYKFANRC